MQKWINQMLSKVSSKVRNIHKLSLVVFMAIICQLVSAADYSWLSLTSRHGLAQLDVYCILKDSRGFMWFGSDGGVDRYDGYEFKNYSTSNGLNNNFIRALYEDEYQNLWIGTLGGGISIINLRTGKIFQFIHGSKDKSTISNDFIYSIVGDSNGNVWIGTNKGVDQVKVTESINENSSLTFESLSSLAIESKSAKVENVKSLFLDDKQLWIASYTEGLLKYNLEEKRLSSFNQISKEVISSNLTAVFKDSYGLLWIGTWDKGLFSYDKLNQSTVQYQKQAGNVTSLSYNSITAIDEGEDGSIIVGTSMGGVNILKRDINNIDNSFTVKQYKNDPEDNRSLSNNSIYSLYVDNRGFLWFGTFGGGVNKAYYSQDLFKFIYYDMGNANSIRSNQINAIFSEGNGRVWMGSNDGLVRNETATNGWFYYRQNDTSPFKISNDGISSILVDSRKHVWLGCKNGDLNHVILNDDGSFAANTVYHNYQIDSIDSEIGAISSIVEDDNGNKWIGTTQGGLYQLQKKNNNQKVSFRRHIDSRADVKDISVLKLDETGNLWIGSYTQGLFLFSTAKFKWNQIKLASNNLPVKKVMDIHFGKLDDVLWVATDKGLCSYDKFSRDIEFYAADDKLGSNNVKKIIEDLDGSLWVLNGNYISRINPVSKRIRNYDQNCGTSDDLLFCGGALNEVGGNILFYKENHGLVSVSPEGIMHEDVKPDVYLTDLYVNHSLVNAFDSVNGRVLIKEELSHVNELNLAYDENSFSIGFTALSYRGEKEQSFSYILEGYQEDWVTMGARYRQATFSGLSHGHYKFIVKAANSEGIWNSNECVLDIYIAPPWWKTKWALLIYMVGFVLALFYIIRIARYRVHLLHTIKFERLEKKRIAELQEEKTRFFMDVSHEIRTPLTLILGPLEKMMEAEERNKAVDGVYKNAKRLFFLVNQLLNLRKIELGKTIYQPVKDNFTQLINKVASYFEFIISEKGIDFNIDSPLGEIFFSYDVEKIETVIGNLLSNAFKYTSNEGKVMLRIQQLETNASQDATRYKVIKNPGFSGKAIQLEVIDDGMGIPESEMEFIFNRFHKAQNTDGAKVDGFGVGLELVWKFVELHGGQILVSSKEGEGSAFVIRLPYSSDDLEIRENIFKQISRDKRKNDSIIPKEEQIPEVKELETKADIIRIEGFEDKKPLLLIVEDEKELRSHIRDVMIDLFEVIEASNGKEGIDCATKNEPDLIISDVKMPEMDGISMTYELKNNMLTSHIPIVLLTAMSSDQSKLEGIRNGADEYLIKPFNSKHLRAKVKQLIESKAKLYKKVQLESRLNPKEVTICSGDEKFLEKAMELVEAKIGDAEYTAEEFVAEMSMSKSVLYKKFSRIVNQSPKEFIRTIRIKRAAQLLEQGVNRVSEVAYAVGFSDPQYFSRVFKQQIGKSPSEYSKAFINGDEVD